MPSGAAGVLEPVDAAGQFLDDLEAVLARITDVADSIFPGELAQLMKAAWSLGPDSTEARGSVREQFKALHASLEDVPMHMWVDAGLTGRQLDYKVAAVAWAKQTIERALDEFKGWLPNIGLPHIDVADKARRKVAAACATGLRVFDIVLDSMPILGKEIITEFKGIAETTASVVANLPDEEPRPA